MKSTVKEINIHVLQQTIVILTLKIYCWPVVGHVAREAEGSGNAVPCLLCSGRNVTMRQQFFAVAAIRKSRTTARLSSQDKDLIHAWSPSFCSPSVSKARVVDTISGSRLGDVSDLASVQSSAADKQMKQEFIDIDNIIKSILGCQHNGVSEIIDAVNKIPT